MSIQSDYRAGQREFAEWLRENGVRKVYTVDNGRKVSADGWEHFAWSITVGGANDSAYVFPFMQGVGHTKRPELTELMASLLSDAQSVLSASNFGDWAADLGYSEDSRKAEALYTQILENGDKLAKLFGTAKLDKLLERVAPILERAGL